jgi:hypothetical protein
MIRKIPGIPPPNRARFQRLLSKSSLSAAISAGVNQWTDSAFRGMTAASSVSPFSMPPPGKPDVLDFAVLLIHHATCLTHQFILD